MPRRGGQRKLESGCPDSLSGLPKQSRDMIRSALRVFVVPLVKLASRVSAAKKDRAKDAFLTPFWLNSQVRVAERLRSVYWKPMLAEAGSGVRFSHEVKIIAPRKLSIGRNTKILNKVILDARGGLDIGEDTQVGFESIVLTSSHRFADTRRPIIEQGMVRESVSIGSDVWLGVRVIVLPGVRIGDHVIVGAEVPSKSV